MEPFGPDNLRPTFLARRVYETGWSKVVKEAHLRFVLQQGTTKITGIGFHMANKMPLLQAGKPVALVCHAPGVLRHAKRADGQPLVDGRKVTGFTNSEEAAVELTDVVPFLVEDELKRLGGRFERADDWQSYVVQDGLLITGQNPASSAEAAARVLTELARAR